MTRKRTYFLTLILPAGLTLLFITIGLINRGLPYLDVLTKTIQVNWYHILAGLLAIVLGIELFKKNLAKYPNYWSAFRFTLKIWGLEALFNIVTNLLEGEIKFANNDALDRLIVLLVMAGLIYCIMAVLSSFLVAGIIYQFGLKK